MSDTETAKMEERVAQGLAYIQKLEACPNDELVERMRGTKDKFLAEIDGLSEMQIAFSPGEGQWCVNQVCLHMQDALALVADAICDLAKGNEFPDTTGEEVMGQLADDPGDFALTAKALSATLDKTIAVIMDLPAEPNATLQAPHPLFGMLNYREWIAFNIMHAVVHIRQIQRIKGSPGFPA